MKLWKKIALGLLVILGLGPFLIPVPPVDGVAPGELASKDSQFINLEGIDIHYKSYGDGDTAIILLHGFGASVFSWRDVLEPLAQDYKVFAFDRPAFGLTQRPLNWDGANPYSPEFQVELIQEFMDQLGIDRAILVGHSAGGAVAVDFALVHQNRVQGLVLVAPALAGGGGAPTWTRPILHLPQVRRLGPLFVRSIASRGVDILKSSWHNHETLTEDVIAGYQMPLKVENWDRALWEFTLASISRDLMSRLDEIYIPVLVITGDDDRIIPPSASERVAQALDTRLVVFQDCGHLPHEEYPDKFIRVVEDFIDNLEVESCPLS